MSLTVAVLLAGGSGTRLGSAVPKQFLDVAGKPIIVHTLDVFRAAPSIDAIVALMPADHLHTARHIIEQSGHDVMYLGAGGSTRDASTRAALAVLADHPDDTKVLIHDAVRPLATVTAIESCVSALDQYDAATLAVPATDTIVETDGDVITGMPDRARLRRVQTPQAFRLGLLARCHAAAIADPEFTPTDDCGVVRRYAPNTSIALVAGSDDNIKVTHPQDIGLADRLLRDRTL